MTYGNGVQTEYTYNKANLVSYLSNTKNAAVLSQYSYTYDLAGQQVSKTDHGGQQTAYTYNGIGQLTGEVQSQNSTNMHQYSYQYSAAQNRTQMDLDGVTTAYTYDVNNRLLTQTVGTAATNYTYDANGNQKTAETANGTLQYGYDGLNRMTAAAEPGMSASYSYGANGLRTSKTVDGVTTTYVWDGDQIVLEQIGSMVRKYIRGLNLAAMVSGTDTSYYLYNAHGDVVQLTDGSGTITKNYAYDAFGCELFPSDTDANPFRYCGEYLDRETGTYYLRTRYYQPGAGRFTREDPHWYSGNRTMSQERRPDLLAVKQSGNLYIYAVNNPVLYTDSSGEEVWGTLVPGCGDSIGVGVAGGAGIYKLEDDNGNVVNAICGWKGIGTPNLSADVFIALYSDADTVFDFVYGDATTEGISVSYGTFDIISGKDAYGNDFMGISGGVAIGVTPAEVHIGECYGTIVEIERYNGKTVGEEGIYSIYYQGLHRQYREQLEKDLNLIPSTHAKIKFKDGIRNVN